MIIDESVPARHLLNAFTEWCPWQPVASYTTSFYRPANPWGQHSLQPLIASLCLSTLGSEIACITSPFGTLLLHTGQLRFMRLVGPIQYWQPLIQVWSSTLPISVWSERIRSPFISGCLQSGQNPRGFSSCSDWLRWATGKSIQIKNAINPRPMPNSIKYPSSRMISPA